MRVFNFFMGIILTYKDTSSGGVFCKQETPYTSGVSSATILYKRVRKLRIELGLTQEAFAERANFGYKFYQQIESGKKKHILLETVDRLAKAFGLETWQLIAPNEPKIKKG
jgi:DNA-binding XRE family transcriptional regulator